MIRFTADGKGLVGEVRGSAEKVNPGGEAAQWFHDSAWNAAARCFNRQVEAFGKLRAQTLAHEASQAALNTHAITSREQQEHSFNEITDRRKHVQDIE